jgi:hypothetical protein
MNLSMFVSRVFLPTVITGILVDVPSAVTSDHIVATMTPYTIIEHYYFG